jgi:HlyD family secretion protein
MKTRRRETIVVRAVLPFLLLLGLSTAGCQRGSGVPDSTGTFEATLVDISCIEPGQIISLRVEEGQALHEGDTIAVLDTVRLGIERASVQISLQEVALNRRQAETQLALAEIQLKAARREFARVSDLHEKGSISSIEFDKQETQLDIAKNAVDAAQIARADLDYRERLLREKLRLVGKRIADAVIRAPMDGTVVEKYREEGETLSPAETVVSLADLRHMYALMYIPEPKLGRVELNQGVRLRIDSHPDRDFSGTISWISPEAEFTPKNVQTREARVELVYAVKVTVDNPDGIFKIGMPVEAYLDYK